MREIKAPNNLLGSKLVSNLGPKLYNDTRYAVRELVQNAYDSINDLENEQFTGEFPASMPIERVVEISIEPNTKQLHIFDKGTGMNEEEIWKFCSLGMNTKQPGLHTGMFGIGTYAGAAIGTKLEVKTKRYKGKQYKAIIDFNVIFENELKYGSPEYISNAEELVNTAVKVYEDDEQYKEEFHFTHVKITLRDNPNKVFVNPALSPSDKKKRADNADENAYFEDVFNFLRMYCPVAFPDDMDTSYLNLIRTELSLINSIQKPIKLYLNKHEVLKFDPSDYISGLKACSIKSKKTKQPVAQVWYGLHEKLEAIKQPWIRGLVLYKDGFAVDTIYRKSVSSLFFNREDIGFYYTGEIHIIKNDVYPNMERTEIAESVAWSEVSEAIEEFIKPIEKNVRERSDYTNAVKKIDNAISNGQTLLKQNVTGENCIEHITSLGVWRDKVKGILKHKTLKQLPDKEYKLNAIIKRVDDKLKMSDECTVKDEEILKASIPSKKISSPFIEVPADSGSNSEVVIGIPYNSDNINDSNSKTNNAIKETKELRISTLKTEMGDQDSISKNIDIGIIPEYVGESTKKSGVEYTDITLKVSNLRTIMMKLVVEARKDEVINSDELVDKFISEFLESKS